MTNTEPYLLLNESGAVEIATDDPEQVTWEANRSGRPWAWMAGFGAEPQENPRPSAGRALELAGLRPIDRAEVMSLSPKQAFRLVLPYFHESRRAAKRRMGTDRGQIVLSELMVPGKGLLTENAKLSKRSKAHPPAMALGLALLPESSAFTGRTEGGVDLSPMRPATGGVTLCSNSSPACRRTCLVYSGQNQAMVANNFAKMAKTKALLEQPVAFLRLLVYAIERYATARRVLGSAMRREVMRFLRLNVFSDVPWERFFPWIFEDERIHFYDYTKVPGRHHPRYDLSFSYSGQNLRHCDAELQGGRRIVIVFTAPTYVWSFKAKEIARKKRLPREQVERAYSTLNPLPKYVSDPGLLGGTAISVVDGDLSDLRPFDPGGVIVGLRFKPPKGRVHEGVPERFVVRGRVVESDLGPVYELPETPLSRPVAAVARV